MAFTTPTTIGSFSARTQASNVCVRPTRTSVRVSPVRCAAVKTLQDWQSPVVVPISSPDSSTHLTVDQAPVFKFLETAFDPELHYNKVLKEGNYHLDVIYNASNSVTLSDGRTFTLRQLHMHSPSENHLEQRTFKVEMHFVFTDEVGKYCVLGVFFDNGAYSDEMEKILDGIDQDKQVPGNLPQHIKIDINELLGNALDRENMITFIGSLTTPNDKGVFVRGVEWIVSRMPAFARYDQMDRLVSQIAEPNAREIQPDNGRKYFSYYK